MTHIYNEGASPARGRHVDGASPARGGQYTVSQGHSDIPVNSARGEQNHGEIDAKSDSNAVKVMSTETETTADMLSMLTVTSP